MVVQIIVYLQSSIMPKGGKAVISLRFPFGKGFYFFDTTAPGSRVQAVGIQSTGVVDREFIETKMNFQILISRKI